MTITHNQQGMVLVTVLLYMLVITFLLTCVFSASALQTKISTHFYQEKQAFEYAEVALETGEQKINPNLDEGDGNIDIHTRYQFRKLMHSKCGLFYQVDAIGVMMAKVHLQSIFTFPHEGENPCWDPTLKAVRVVWKQVSDD